MGAVSGSVVSLVNYGLPDDYYATYPDKVRGLTLADISSAAKKVIHPDNLVWVIVGDRSKVEAGIRELGYGDFRMLDANGNVIN
jgi:zinc protease